MGADPRKTPQEITPEEGKGPEYKPGTTEVIHSSEPRMQLTEGTGPQTSKVNHHRDKAQRTKCLSCRPEDLSFMRVRLGEHNLRKFDGPEQLRSVSRIIPHPGYEARTHRHDIMLLRLFRPARLTPQVRPVALPTRCPLLGEDCVVSGWGLLSDNSPGATGSHKSQVRLPDTLHCANISIISEASCNKDYPGRVLPTMVCAGVEGGGTDSCEGDSGGPLVCGGALQGIVSWGDVPCDTTTKPGVYTKVCSYMDWIRKNMRRN